MYRDNSVGVVVPAYNEEEFIRGVITGMPEYVDRIYVIDDCSSDGTWDAIPEAAKKDCSSNVSSEANAFGGIEESHITDGGGSALSSRAIRHDLIGRVVPIEHRNNLGAGGAIKTGYLASLSDEIDITVTVDGDGQMDLSQMTKLLDPIVDGEAEYTKGNRLLYEEYRKEMPRFRFFGNSILTFLTKIASGYWKTMDPQNGYTAISHYALDNVRIEEMYEYYGYCNDLLIKLNANGIRIADVAMPAVYGNETSGIDYPEYIQKVSGMLLRNFLWRLKTKYLVLDFHPLALFYLFGATTAGTGVMAGIWSVYMKVVAGDPLFVRASLSMMLFTIGSMFMMFAMMFDMQINEDKETQIYD